MNTTTSTTEVQDLMDFNSPLLKENLKCSPNGSPGNNPFDSVTKNIDTMQETQFIDSANINAAEYFLKCDNFDLSEKESLGVLKLEELNCSFNNDLTNSGSACKILVSNIFQTSKSFNSPLNTAFLLPFSGEFPSISTNSMSGGSCFNSCSLEVSEPSNILSPKSEAILNDAFLKSNSKIKFTSLNTPKANEEYHETTRIHYASLPEFKKPSENKELPLQILDLIEGDDDVFEDAVFVEANDLASKLADGSLLMCENQTSLDCITPPILVSPEESEDEVDTESVFKEIDKTVPIVKENLNDTKDLNCSVLPVSTKEEEFKENLNNIFNNSHRSSSTSSTKSPPDPKKLLTNLYSIINKEQNEEGEQLLFSLANILCSGNKCDNLEDSGHSSIEQDHQDAHDIHEVLDLRINKSDTENMDLSTSTKTENIRLNKSFSLSAHSKPFRDKSDSNSDCSNIKSTKPVGSSKLKPKKLENTGKKVNKGPLKALIPVMDMSKRFGGKIFGTAVTPQRLPVSSLFKSKTSTPINEPQLKPMAQSTPGITTNDTRKLPCLNKSKIEGLVSPVTKRDSIGSVTSTRSSQSASTPNLSNQSGNSKRDSSIPSPRFIYRRHSATDLKTAEAKTSFTRSYSIGPSNKEVLINKLKQTATSFANTPKRKSNPITRDTQQSNPRSILNENNAGINKNVKTNLLGKLKKNKIGKENLKNK